jgi:hypothetical protein
MTNPSNGRQIKELEEHAKTERALLDYIQRLMHNSAAC